MQDALTSALPQETLPPAETGGTSIEHRLQFTGAGGEYFRIWIVNLLFSILTLGIYSAWAKVRREQYFHRNTVLDGSGFDYHGDPKAILKGRIIAVALLFVLAIIENVAHDIYYPALLLVSPLIPWLLVRSLAFRARNTSFRGLRFNFHGTYIGICKVFLGYFIALIALFGAIAYQTQQAIEALASGGQPDSFAAIFVIIQFMFEILLVSLLLMPAFLRSLKLFQFNNLAFGASRFQTRCSALYFYGIYLRSISLLLVPLTMFALALFFRISASPVAAIFMLAATLLLYAGILVSQPYLLALTANLVWNNTRLDKHGFAGDQSFWGIAGIVLSNWLLVVLTLGLYWPWAAVRLAAYRARHTAVLAAGSLDDFIAEATQEKNAVGEEIADAFDFDIAF
ncbi:MAG: DUF898 domain-containing protein [Azoarcus sp.]|jgi:uncharacterized membrane protein YjgN (DUF898 family)|nr:DUF898 domain-containing protein [Azoarcus sp.]